MRLHPDAVGAFPGQNQERTLSPSCRLDQAFHASQAISHDISNHFWAFINFLNTLVTFSWDNVSISEVEEIMTDVFPGAFSNRLKEISSELKEIDLALKAGATPDLPLLQEFRQVLDNARLTAWTVSELLSAVESQKDPAKVLSFVAAERLRRSNQMLKDLCVDIEHQGVTWQTNGIQALFDTVNSLQVELRKLVEEHRGRFGRVGDRGR